MNASEYGQFGRCYDADTCVLDPACQFYDEHRTDDDADAAGRPAGSRRTAPTDQTATPAHDADDGDQR